MAKKQIEAPVPGVLFHKPDPESAAFKKSGDQVAVGDTLALVELMKSFMPVQAEVAGTFKGYLIDDGENLEAGDTVCEIEV
jgi:acetyl-CoA carboxylase biotin carboxyl carrier protein